MVVKTLVKSALYTLYTRRLQRQLQQGSLPKHVALNLDGNRRFAIQRGIHHNGNPDPDLIIRTSGELRLSGFMLWQSTHSELYFCDTLWPAFRKVDFLRALRSCQHRERRFGK